MYIHKFHIKNYRSLKDVNIGDLSKAVILYGDNDSGKSNILSFLDILFQPKISEEVTIAAGEEFTNTTIGFWKGQFDNFSNNFYLNNQSPITFSVLIKIERSEVKALKKLPEKFINLLPHNHDEDVLLIEGSINSLGGDRAEMRLEKVEFNQKIIYSLQGENPEYLSDKSFEDFALSEKRDIFDSLINKLEGAFLSIPPDRFLEQEEEEQQREIKVELTSKSLKNWLFQAIHDQSDEKVIRDIASQFDSEPFNHGNISIVRVGKNELEIFVEGKNGLKLPIGRRGSGVQQILMILAYISKAKSPIVGIEEIEINLSPTTQKRLVTSLLELINSETSIVKQIFFTTHSPHVGKRNEAERRGVSMENGQTKVKKPSEAEVSDFFSA